MMVEVSGWSSVIEPFCLCERVVKDRFKKAFKRNWGATGHTKRIRVNQDLNRLYYNSLLSHLRKMNLPMRTIVFWSAPLY